ncbi:MAG: hypothetical protein ABII64_07295 [Elusimicrobiota bacterium]
MKKALMDLHCNPFYSDYMFYPIGIELLTYNFLTLNNLVSIPLQYVFNLIFINNLFILLTYVLSGFGAYLLVKYITGSKLAAFIAGLIFAFCPFRSAKIVISSIDLINMQWIPYYALYLIKTLNEKEKYKYAVYAGAFLALTATCHYYYMIYLGFFTIIYIIAWYFINRNKESANIVKKLAILFTTFIIIMSPLIYFILKDINNKAYQTPDTSVYKFINANIIDLVMPNPINTFFGDNKKKSDQVLMESTISTGYFVMILSCVIIFARIRKDNIIIIWSILLVIFTLFTLGGNVIIPYIKEPVRLYTYYIFEKLPILNAVRVPSRFVVMMELCLAVLSGIAVKYLLYKVKNNTQKYIITSIIAAILLFEFISVPIGLCSMTVPDYYRSIGDDKEDCTVLEVPLGWGNSNSEVGIQVRDVFFFQTIHGKRILNGGGGRSRTDKIVYYTNIPIINTILDMQDGKDITPDYILQDKKLAKAIFNYYKIKYIVLHSPYTNNKIIKYFMALGEYNSIYKNEDIVVFKNCLNTLDKYNKNERWSKIWYGEGWINARWKSISEKDLHWSSNYESKVYLYTPNAHECELNIDMFPLPLGTDKQTIALTINNQYLADIGLGGGRRIYNVPIRASIMKNGINTIKLKYGIVTDMLDGKEKSKSDWTLAVSVVGIVVVDK